MNIQYYAKKIKLSDELKDLIAEKLASLKKYKGKLNLLDVRVDISRDQHHKKGDVFRMEINVHLPNKVLRVVEEAADIYMALDLAAKKLERQARDVKDRLVSRSKRG